jgi:preprotein translocase SecE subunit
MKSWINQVREFFRQVWEEVLKCTRPSGAELRESTTVVVTTMAVIGVFILVCDGVISMLLNWLVRLPFTF